MCFRSLLFRRPSIAVFVGLSWLVLNSACLPRTAKSDEATPTSPGTEAPVPDSNGSVDTPAGTPDEAGDVSDPSGSAGPDAVLQDALVHVIMALDSYSAGDFPSTREELDVALGTLLALDVNSSTRARLKLLGKHLPPGYEQSDLTKIYRETGKRKEEVEAVAEGEGPGEGEGDVGGPQGMGELVGETPGGEASTTSPGGESETGEGDEGLLPGTESASGLSRSDMAYVRKEIERIVTAFGDTEYPHSELFEEQVAQFIRVYQTELNGFFTRSMVRSAKYMPMVQEILSEKGVPGVMAYIAFVESGFRPNAVSRAGAVGLWQFMPRTGGAYGLNVSRSVDERLDPVKSTIAAREYFLDLVAIFGSRSFLLAMASYNAGEGKVQYCLKQVEDPFTQRTFWDIAPCLRKETREYIPRIIAAAIVVQDAERFGFGETSRYLDQKQFTVVEVPSPTSLSLLARLCDMSVEELLAINLDLDSNATTTPKGKTNYPLLIPTKNKKDVDAELELIAKRKEEEVASAKQEDTTRAGSSEKAGTGSQGSTRSGSRSGSTKNPTPTSGSTKTSGSTSSETRSGASTAESRGGDDRTKYVKYVVQPGNALGVVAEDFGTSVAKLEEWNPYLAKRGLQAGDTIFVYELDWSYRKWVHKVKSGDTLGGIAHHYGVDIEKVQRWNGLKDNRIQAGSSIVIYTSGEATRVAERNSSEGVDTSAPSSKPIVYVVQSGNNLSVIGAMFDVNFRDIMKWNNLSNGRINAGQKLTIYPGKDLVVEHYKVKPGDTLSGVAKKYKVDPAYLAAVNGMTKKDRLASGQTLLVYRKK